jgi:23S rRNA (guanine745-N1)-methyltransferase
MHGGRWGCHFQPLPEDPAGFRRLPTEMLRSSIQLTSSEQIADLLAMTPHLFRASAEGRAAAAALTALSLSVNFRLTFFERNMV